MHSRWLGWTSGRAYWADMSGRWAADAVGVVGRIWRRCSAAVVDAVAAAVDAAVAAGGAV